MVEILVVRFTSAEAMDAAIATAQNTYEKWRTLNTEVFTSGYSILVVHGAPGNEDVQQMGASHIGQGALQVIWKISPIPYYRDIHPKSI